MNGMPRPATLVLPRGPGLGNIFLEEVLFSPSYANIMNVETSGASPQTARQDNLPDAGVKASHTMAKTDLERVTRYKSIINSVAENTNIDPALIAAIMSRESRAGNALDSRGYGDHGNAFGLMQVDLKPNGGGNSPRGRWDSREHVEHATGILVDFINKISRKFPDWSREWKLKGGISAYNMGDGNVNGYHNVDEKTTGGDYSNDVVARAQWYKKKGGF